MSEELTFKEVSAHNTKKDLYVVIHDKIYNSTTFVDEHPYVPSPSEAPFPSDAGVNIIQSVRRLTQDIEVVKKSS